MLHTIKVYLGLGPDDEYDDTYFEGEYDQGGYDEPDEFPDHRPSPVSENHGISTVRTTRRPVAPEGRETEAVGTIRPIRPVRSDEMAPRRPSVSNPPDRTPDPEMGLAVRPVRVGRSKPRTIEPESFADAKLVADGFKSGTPVVINMQGLPSDLARRLIDFASGVCYVEGGSMEKLSRGVFLVTPRSADVSDEERRRLEERGYRR